MARLFDEHRIRKVKSLSGTWQMKKDADNVGRSEGWQNGLSGAHTVTVPSVWNSEIDLLTHVGTVWYEKKFYTDGGTLKLKFGAVMTEADVYFDGEYLGNHYGGFTSFEYILENVTAGEHRINLRVNNEFDSASIPQPVLDWYYYGGITRPVELDTLNGICVLGNIMRYTLNGNSATPTFEIDLVNATDKEITDTVTVTVGDDYRISESVTLGAREQKTVTLSGKDIEGIELWSPESPKLYTLLTTTSTDDLYDKVGFRTIEIHDRAVYLNGKKLMLRGINRHEDYPDFGMAFPEMLMHKDIDIIERMGCNSIRGSHYPNNPVFVDLLDEHGITFWSEIPIWGGGFTPEQLADPKVIERGLTMHREMVKQYYNHPSIIIWGMHNEIRSDTEEGKNISKIYYEYLKSAGGNRIVTYATNKRMLDICYEYCDMICLNIYVGWYDNPLFKDWKDCTDKMEDYIQKMGGGEKPVVMSEFGAAAIYGHHTFDNIKWTEEYQANLLADCLNLFFSRPEYAGAYVWQFSDIRTSQPSTDRARGYNNKGIVNEYRRPKLAYYKVSDVYNRLKSEGK